MRHFPVLVVAVPILAAVLTPLIGMWRKKACMPWAAGAAFVTSVMASSLVWKVYKSGKVISYHLGSWKPPFGIEIRFDEFSAATLMIAGLGLMIIVFSKSYIEKELVPEKIVPYYTLLLLNLGGMIGFVVTGDIFNLFVFLEVISLSAYALTAISEEKIAEMAAFKYLLLGAISSIFTLLAIAFLYSITGTLNMNDLMFRLAHTPYTKVATIAFVLFIVGFCVKAAVFPMHVWLPDAHAIAPSPVSAVLSGLVVKIGIIGILRVFYIYNFENSVINIPPITTLLCWMGGIAIVMGAIFALFQDDIKMLLAYSTVSNIGYIIMGIGLASGTSIFGGVIHIFNHAIIKTTLFLCAGSLIYSTGYRRLTDLRGVGRKMPITAAIIVVGALSIVGIPPTAGFICKWYITLGALRAGKPLFAVILLAGALLIFVYYVKIINAIYFLEPTRSLEGVEEAPAFMLVPMIVLGVACLVFGVGAFIPLAVIRPGVVRLIPEATKELIGL